MPIIQNWACPANNNNNMRTEEEAKYYYLNEQIFELYGRGVSIQNISERLNATVGYIKTLSSITCQWKQAS